jgi:hypothetical protein
MEIGKKGVKKKIHLFFGKNPLENKNQEAKKEQ